MNVNFIFVKQRLQILHYINIFILNNKNNILISQ